MTNTVSSFVVICVIVICGTNTEIIFFWKKHFCQKLHAHMVQMTNKCTEIKVFKDPIKYVGVYSPDGFLPLRHKGKKYIKVICMLLSHFTHPQFCIQDKLTRTCNSKTKVCTYTEIQMLCIKHIKVST